MDAELIERLARGAGIEPHGNGLARVVRAQLGEPPHEGASGFFGESAFSNVLQMADIQRFAQLVAAECIKLCEEEDMALMHSDVPEMSVGSSNCVFAIREKFGVKE
jgi:hypothetical protein